MDPLSVTASIVGILAAAGKIGELLHGTISTAKDAPSVILGIACEVEEFRAALSALQILLANLESTHTPRAALIQIDQLIATLTDSVLTFSELETAIAPFVTLRGAKVPRRARIRWVRAEDSCNKIVERLQRHKATISLMLNIFQCASDADAYQSQSSLQSMVETLLQTNQQLCKRLRNLEDAFDAMSIVSRNFDNINFISLADGDSIATTRPSASNGLSILEAVRVPFAFDDDLQSSRVYRMVKNRGYQHSLPSSAVLTQTWSIFSGLSLADISNISVVALPLYHDDLCTDANYYSFSSVALTGPFEANGIGTNAQAALKTDAPRPSSDYGGVHFQANLYSVVNDARVSVGSSSSPRENIPRRNDASLATCVHADAPQIHMKTLLDPEDQRPKSPISPGQHSESADTDWYWPPIKSVDLLTPCCRGCGRFNHPSFEGEIRKAGHRWHMTCFHCHVCKALLDRDDDLLLLGDGSLVCRGCIYGCAQCGKNVGKHAVVVGEQAFCRGCLRCQTCKNLIGDLLWAHTGRGIFCMHCYQLRSRRRERERMNMPLLSQPAASTDANWLVPPLGGLEKDVNFEILQPFSVSNPDTTIQG